MYLTKALTYSYVTIKYNKKKEASIINNAEMVCIKLSPKHYMKENMSQIAITTFKSASAIYIQYVKFRFHLDSKFLS